MSTKSATPYAERPAKILKISGKDEEAEQLFNNLHSSCLNFIDNLSYFWSFLFFKTYEKVRNLFYLCPAVHISYCDAWVYTDFRPHATRECII